MIDYAAKFRARRQPDGPPLSVDHDGGSLLPHPHDARAAPGGGPAWTGLSAGPSTKLRTGFDWAQGGGGGDGLRGHRQGTEMCGKNRLGEVLF